MKKVLFTLLTLVSLNALAGVPAMPFPGQEGLPVPPVQIFPPELEQLLKPNQSYIGGAVVSVEPLCPVGMMCFTDGTVITIRFTLPNPCTSVEVTKTSFNETLNMAEVTAVQTSMDEALACITVIEEVEEKVTFVNQFPPFDLSFTGLSSLVPISGYTK